MHILWKLKSVRKSVAEITETSRITTLCRPSCATKKKDTLPNAYGKTHQYYPISYRGLQKRFMNTAIDNYFNSSYKNMVSFFCQEKISAKELHEILAMIENPKEENRLLPEITIVY
jgi:predicted transcriptional regulator